MADEQIADAAAVQIEQGIVNSLAKALGGNERLVSADMRMILRGHFATIILEAITAARAGGVIHIGAGVCCEPGCGAPAEFEIHDTNDHRPEAPPISCAKHLGGFMSSAPPVEPEGPWSVYNYIKPVEEHNKMKTQWNFKNAARPQGSSNGFWYDIANGYIKPEEVLADPEQVALVRQAQHTLQNFEQAMEAADLINEF